MSKEGSKPREVVPLREIIFIFFVLICESVPVHSSMLVSHCSPEKPGRHLHSNLMWGEDLRRTNASFKLLLLYYENKRNRKNEQLECNKLAV